MPFSSSRDSVYNNTIPLKTMTSPEAARFIKDVADALPSAPFFFPLLGFTEDVGVKAGPVVDVEVAEEVVVGAEEETGAGVLSSGTTPTADWNKLGGMPPSVDEGKVRYNK
jgi:hypothetical protein